MSAAQPVAIVIAAYKSENVIARAIASTLAQPEAGEVVVVSDASPDGTAIAARGADDGSGRLKVIEQTTNRGPAAARNAAIAATTSPWITILDDDDFMEPRRLSRLLARAMDVDFIADDLLLVEQGREDGPRTPMWFDGKAAPHALSLTDFVLANCPDPSRPRRESARSGAMVASKFNGASKPTMRGISFFCLGTSSMIGRHRSRFGKGSAPRCSVLTLVNG